MRALFAHPDSPAVSRLQLAAVLSVFGAGLAAELAALGLALKPTSAFLWWVNLELFSGLDAAFRLIHAAVGASAEATIAALAGGIVLAFVVHALRLRLALAVMSNFAFLVCGFVGFAWFAIRFTGPGRTASLTLETVAAGVDTAGLLIAFLTVAALVGAAVSHLAYISAAWRDRRRR